MAQAKAEAGCDQFRLYCKGAADAVPTGAYLIADGENSEVVTLRSLEGDMATLAAPCCEPTAAAGFCCRPSGITPGRADSSLP